MFDSRALACATMMVIASMCGTAAAWEGTFDTGSVKVEPGFSFGEKARLSFGHVNVAYPATEGAVLGQGWDHLLGRTTSSICIENFDERKPPYQFVAPTKIRHAVDIETLKVAFNIDLSSSAKGTIYGVTGKAETSLKVKTDYDYASTDEVFVAQASIESGKQFIAPEKVKGSIVLRDGLAEKRMVKSEDFRKQCGDGFVSSIISGADLYIIYRFRELDEKTRKEINTSVKGAISSGDLFGASSALDFGSVIQKTRKEKRLEILMQQNGGVLDALPTDLESAKKKYMDLPKDAKAGAREMYMVITPYTELQGVDPMQFLMVADVRRKAIRYYNRLLTLLDEINAIRADALRNRRDDKLLNDDKYYYSYRHRVRQEDWSSVYDSVVKDIHLTSSIVRDLDDPQCGILAEIADCSSKAPAKNWAGVDCARAENDPTCLSLERRSSLIDFDDLKFRIRLPLPRSIISDEDRVALEAESLSVEAQEQNKTRYTRKVVEHWVLRIGDERCRLFKECLNTSDIAQYSKAVRATLQPVAPVLVKSKQVEPRMHFAYVVPAGYAARVSIGQNDTHPKSTAVTLFKRNAGEDWVVLENDIKGFGRKIPLEATPKGFEIGVFSKVCFPGLGQMTPACNDAGPKKLDHFVDPMSVLMRYWDHNQEMAKHWNLEIRIDVFPDPASMP